MASAELERSHSAMGSLSAAEKTPPAKSPSPTAAKSTILLERSASSSSSSSVGGGGAVNNNNYGAKRPTASERLQEHRSRMHQQSRRPLTATTSVDGNTAHGALETGRSGGGGPVAACLDYSSRKGPEFM